MLCCMLCSICMARRLDCFTERASDLLDKVHRKLREYGFGVDESKTEVQWIFASDNKP